MTDIAALNKVLPVSSLDTQTLALIRGFSENLSNDWREPCISLLEPPAGLHVPFIDPVEALTVLLIYEGEKPDAALARAKVCHEELRGRLMVPNRVIFYDYLMCSSPECLSAVAFNEYLREKRLVSPEIIDYLERITAAIADAPIFKGPDTWPSWWSLSTMPALPPPNAMIEFFPVPLWDDEHSPIVPFETWRESMRSVAAVLQGELGKPVYYFADPNDDCDEDNIHRFLVMHWCCTSYPDSAFVQFILEVSGAANLEALKEALIDPKNYTHPFQMNDAFIGLEANICRVKYLPPATRKGVGIVFSSPVAQAWAGHLALQQINADIILVAPEDLIPREWRDYATRNAQKCSASFILDDNVREPLALLAQIDELYVIADGCDSNERQGLNVSESIQVLLWESLALGLPTRYFYPDSTELGNLESSLGSPKASEHLAMRVREREAYTSQLKEIRVECDFFSSGLWDSRGRMLGYDHLSIPFPLARRLAAWQRDFDYTVNPPEPTDDGWWECHEREQVNIAREIQEALGSSPRVMIFRHSQWKWIGEVPIESEG
ncbi:MAG: hypothetical protein H3C30_02315 [Candidatus Hydrogenedentes bacterium]|nr:hypothetical protein [Candidatus Hydrogenedentota bacterium]